MSGNGREAIANVRVWSADPAGCQGVVGRHSWISGRGRRSSRMTVSGMEALPDVQEWSEGHPECLGVVGRPFRMIGGSLKCPGVVKKHSWMFGSGCEAN